MTMVVGGLLRPALLVMVLFSGWEAGAVDLSDQGLKSIPSDKPQNITKLILNKNLIQLSPSDTSALASYPELTELDLDSNLVTEVPGKAFAALSGLNKLHLSNNNITRMDAEAFSGLDNLVELDISNNPIMLLPASLFSSLTKLEVLNLRATGLEVLSSTLIGLKTLRSVDLQENPWNCSCLLAEVIHGLTVNGVQIGPKALCAYPEDQRGISILEATSHCFPTTQPPSSTTVQPPAPPATTTQSPTQPQPNTEPQPQPNTQPQPQPNTQPQPQPNTQPQPQPATNSATIAVTTNDSISNKAQIPGSGDDSSGVPVVGNTWKFLVGVLAIALSTSMLIVCAVKSPSWYKLLFNYRHQRLRDEDEPNVFATGGRYSNYSLDTQQTETSAYELENGRDDEEVDEEEEEDDGYIEDRYIETADYRVGGEYTSTATTEEQA